ncbi:NAD(P)-dependent oxidoreductase [Ectopseudomonas toyotomiensis]|uniref:NAD(P)-dependent oxidoreductase n=1 Tax=Ectopseudomonas toyotomiensis TaxID=554344 RepID=A0AA42IHQ7_9GAMM|nr:NAD(P)-dependent oxidoreductase [Pseudomonas toyotomiensis]MBG0838879.1 NAD(P)-dependent oxidoreductase [Pseudomonas toyotomiensis]MDH0700046.1 NAD(P)-dependent oxidoreductase [Pseudomonas toyotomiensis]
MTTIAFAGLGSMGLPMAKNMLAAGHVVRGIDLNPVALATLAEAGGQPADAASAASGADVLILMVVNAAQAEQVLFDNGALEALAENGIVCLMATCPPAAVERIAARVRAAGRRFVDAPVSGGTAGAIAGSLTIMAACERDTFEAVQPVFEGIGQRIFHVGERAGQGATVKAVNQLLCGVHIAVVAEAFALAAKVGVELPILLEIMGGSAASSWMLKDRGPRMLQTEPEVSSAVDIFVKDLGIVLEAGRDAQAALPIAAVAHQLFLATAGRGEGRADDSQVIRSYYALNGTSTQG